MFLQVGLMEKDRPFHRFLWRDLDQEKEPDIYEFQRLPFGNTASPFCAQHALHSHAEKNKDCYPKADTVNNAMYVDDVLDSCETVSEAITLRQQTSELVSGAGFSLRKWMSNEADVIKDVPVEDRLPGLELRDGNLPTLKTLGVLWDALEDIFKFHVNSPSLTEPPTKRQVLSSIAKLFDPLQFLAPFTIRAKFLLQKTWAVGIGWEDVLPDDLRKEWNDWVKELSSLSGFEVPRPLRLPAPTITWLHTFSDASKDAYAAVSYLVCEYDDHGTTSRLVASKSRVTPLKSVTIPRLELMRAVLASRLTTSLLQTLDVNGATYWTDSTNVLYWVRNQSRTFKPFVANRVAEIQRHSDPEQWRHIPGEINPADLPTRGIMAANLCNNTLWLEGPEFLTDTNKPWPERIPGSTAISTATEKEMKSRSYASKESSTEQDRLNPSRYSSWNRLVRVTTRVKRFLSNSKTPLESRNLANLLSDCELLDAQRHWIRQAQAEVFPGGTKDQRLIQLTPMLDSDGLLRIDGRLSLAKDMPYQTRHPIILPTHHFVTRLIIVDTHEKLWTQHGHRTRSHRPSSQVLDRQRQTNCEDCYCKMPCVPKEVSRTTRRTKDGTFTNN